MAAGLYVFYILQKHWRAVPSLHPHPTNSSCEIKFQDQYQGDLCDSHFRDVSDVSGRITFLFLLLSEMELVHM